ncbi:SRPBCC family protein [Jatrophihabitans sp.]|uniref:SRPBCC family protein n=1 Tax=Jatrophihabitans sp. TaxID=1932789 RepID=UPI002CA4CD69|nr:SRPBCC family protein [Jatrophihabitans sp.]
MTMAQSESENGRQGGGSDGLTGTLRSAASRNPVTEKLLHSAEGYLGAQSERLVGSLGEKVTGATRRLTDVANGSAEPGSLLGKTAKNVAQGDSPAKAALKGAAGSVTEKVKDTVKSAFKGKGKGSGGKKSMNIEESIDVGVPVRQAYNRWTQYTEFPKWSKGVQSVSQEDETKTGWNAKVFWSKRNWNAKITEQVPDQRIAWTSDGPKGTVDGVVTFHELAPNLTRILLALEYHPAGLFEKTGNIWRAQGRRVRLDLKLYRRFVMMSNEEVEGWRGEIRDGEVVRDHDEAMAEEEQDGSEQDSAEDYDEDAGDEESEADEDYADEDAGDEESEADEDYADEDEEGEYDEDEDDLGDEDDYADDEDYADSDEDYEEEPAPRRRAS